MGLKQGHVIRQLRVTRGWTQRQLARKAGVGINTIHRLERRGLRHVDVAERVVRALGIRIEQLEDLGVWEIPDLRLTRHLRWFYGRPAAQQHQLLALLEVVETLIDATEATD
jgi:transcriptional regulator with XRE-family HTH domain